MAIKPILFNSEMVKAILEGRKTQTRRTAFLNMELHEFCNKEYPNGWWFNGRVFKSFDDFLHYTQRPKCKYRPSDILWVRETWQYIEESDSDGFYIYAADHQVPGYMKWHPSIHMPKEAARIFLRVKDVRVERLQDCGNGWCLDIEKEGVRTPQDPILYVDDDEFHNALRAEMEKLWDSTIKPNDVPQYGWNANPWVWVVEFERCEKPEGWC